MMMMMAMGSLQLLQFHPLASSSSPPSSSSLPTLLRHHHPPPTTVSPLLLHYHSPPIRRRRRTTAGGPVLVGKEETELRVSSDQQEDPSREDLEYVSQIQRVIPAPSHKPRFLLLLFPYFLFVHWDNRKIWCTVVNSSSAISFDRLGVQS